MQTKISIVIPCYNAEKYIERCIESLLNQTIGLENLELIFVNDASTDSTLYILLEFEKKYSENIVVIDLSENCKQGGARNVGINYSNGIYIGFVDSDDWIEPSMYEKLYNKMIEYNCDVVACRNFFDYPDGTSQESTKGVDYFIRVSDTIEDRCKFMIADVGSGVWSKLYRKSIIVDNEIFFPEKLAYEDNYWMSIMILYIKSFYMLEENLYHYSVNLGSTIQAINAEHHFDRLTIELMKIDKYKELGVFEIYHDEIENTFLRMFYLNTLHIFFTRFYPLPFDRIHKIIEIVLELFPKYKDNPYIVKNPPGLISFFRFLEMDLDANDLNEIAEAYKKALKQI